MRSNATAEIERLTRERDEAIASSDAVCNSYAAENQRLFDRAETAECERDEARVAWARRFCECLLAQSAVERLTLERDEARRDAECQRGNADDNYAKLQAAEAALARGRALLEPAAKMLSRGKPDDRPPLREAHRAICLALDALARDTDTGGDRAL